MHYIVFFQDERQNNSSTLNQVTGLDQSTSSFLESKQKIVEWLNQLEKSIQLNEIELSFLPTLEDKLQSYKVSFVFLKHSKRSKHSIILKNK